MENMNFFPFQRNKYFYGKLLSVDDFQKEQKYFNDKRRMINRYIHGSGVVGGMNVVVTDDTAVSIERGIALDYVGREIVVDVPITKQLSLLDGFLEYKEKEDRCEYAYLCIEYDEKESEPVHNIASSVNKNDSGVEYNRYMEGYRLYLTTDEPNDENFNVEAYYEETKVLYHDNGIKIKQIAPRFISSNDVFNIRIIVEKMNRNTNVEFSYELDLECIQGINLEKQVIKFNERLFEKNSKYEFQYQLKAKAVKDVMGKIAIKPNSFKLSIDKKKIDADIMVSNSVKIVEGSTEEAILNNYYLNSVDEIVKNTYQQAIYLAKIYIISVDKSYVIDYIENMPFHQYIYNNTVAAIHNRDCYKAAENLKKRTDSTKNNIITAENQFENNIVYEEGNIEISKGTAIIDIDLGGRKGEVYFSKDIIHGLGLGYVHIILGRAVSLNDDSSIIFGSPDIFEEEENSISIQTAARADVTNGTFRIGIKFLKDSSKHKVKITWMAVKDTKSEDEIKKDTMNLSPDLPNIGVGEKQYFEAIIDGHTESRINWSIKESDGGTINKNGMYIAPNKEGIFEIVAESMDNKELSASTFVVVRENI